MSFLSSLTELKLGEKIMGFVTACATWRLMLTSTLKHENWVTYNTKQVAISADKSFVCKLNMLQKFTLWSKLTLTVSSRISLSHSPPPPPLNLSPNSCLPLPVCSPPPIPHWNFNICFPTFCGSPNWFIIFKFPPPKSFDFCITGLHKLTTSTLSTCVTSCTTYDQKQVSRSNLISKYTYYMGNSLYFKQKIFCL